MPENLSPRPRHLRVPSRRRIGPPIARRPARARKPPRLRILSRSTSEPILWTTAVLFDVIRDDAGVEKKQQRQHAHLLRPHTFTDAGGFFFSSFSSSSLLPSPPLPRPCFLEEAKVVVSVTVEGSPGPVRAMVKLGATVDEAIGVIVDRYKRDGRSSKFVWDQKDSLQLHLSHFSLQSLNKSDKIGEVGSRSFYLRKSCGSNSFGSASEEGDSRGGSEIEPALDGRLQAAPPPPAHLFFSFIAKRFSKFQRRTRRLWRVVACITCA